MENIGKLGTESRNKNTIDLDLLSSKEMVEAIVKAEKDVISGILNVSKEIGEAVDLYAKVLKSDGRIIVAGSGCSGDYGAIDIMELNATFGQKNVFTDDPLNDKVIALHVQNGWVGDPRLKKYRDFNWKDIQSRDGSEDSLVQAEKDLEEIKFNDKDLLICITASGRSPAIVELAKEAKKRKGKVVSIVNNKNTIIEEFSNITIPALVGPPALTGSGRMSAGTSAKIIITTISTAAYTKIGSVYSNLMVNLNIKERLDNSKFIDRSIRIIKEITGKEFDECKKALVKSDYDIKVACIMIVNKVTRSVAEKELKKSKGFLRKVIG